MYELFIVLYLLVALALIVLVLIQHGKGADMGASFGAGGSATIFGSSGSGNFLTRTTTVLATLFFALSLLLGNLSTDRVKAVDEWQDLSVPVETKAADATEEKKPASDIPVGN
ncbi:MULTISPECIES: preprotein translocase subunit SecG [Rheinheimera]|jgi:preprotein translocase subunit SecG|uniref:Protein-export membrane protein SecG n=1 Tax=Rheinheimera tangshanensis TaxID=400153 RepID=A0A5C8LTQ5_9GAMM|nr:MULTISPECIES: preprotein translocase subunit SecG [Rheinheimera]KOO60026.1 preprotein translocase subunit SecG [Rheinheimera sp. KL1]TXK79079.1 preprotein translocase subunit SecG [Rheinheimera tangshanensis]GGM69040.1 protein-export membrane protein SecG [Rheinheimera tangshanensis]